MIISLGIVSYLTVSDTIDRSMQRRLDLARMIAGYTDSILESNVNRLYDISLSGSINFKDNNWEPEKKALETAYRYSIFTDGIFLLDRDGNKVITYPSRLDDSLNLLSIPYISRVIKEGRPAISDIFTVEPTKKKVVYALVPLKDRNGEIIGVAGGEINPTNYVMSQVIKSAHSGPNTNIEIVDSKGIVIASNNPGRIFTGTDHDKFLAGLISGKTSVFRRCHRCHEGEQGNVNSAERSTDVLAFAPLEMASWGVSILQPEEDVFAPADNLKKTFLFFSVISIGIALLVAVGMSRSIVKPVHELIEATQSIAAGNMSRSIGFGGVDEIGMLSSSFEVMRVKLADSLESLHQYNLQLENRVNERTHEIRQSQAKVERLFKKVISAQEEERKRIARGLHDETMQSLSAILMRMDLCKLYGETLPGGKIDEVREIVLNTLNDLRTMIQNLRPSILDDLGLEAAVRWLLDKHLWEKGIAYFYDISGDCDRRFDPQLETTFFRIIQEAIVNIARHAEAENVFVIMKVAEHEIHLDIEDDGKGFDVRSALKRTEDGRGLGLLGLKERVYLIDGKVTMCSDPELGGTRISLRIPLKTYGEHHV